MLDARQLGLKLIANVTYGYTGASFSGRMPCIEVDQMIFLIVWFRSMFFSLPVLASGWILCNKLVICLFRNSFIYLYYLKLMLKMYSLKRSKSVWRNGWQFNVQVWWFLFQCMKKMKLTFILQKWNSSWWKMRS